MNFKLREYSFWGTIGKGFNLYLNNFLPIILISLLCRGPVILFERLIPLEMLPVEDLFPYSINIIIKEILTVFFNIFTYMLLSAWISHFVSRKFLGASPDEAENDHRISKLVSILMAVWLSILFPIIIAIGTSILIVPGAIILIRCCLSPQILAVEKRPLVQSLKRSWELTKSNKAIVFLYLLVSYQLVLAFNYYTTLLIKLLKPGDLMMDYIHDALWIVSLPLLSCIFVVVYFNIRIANEGFHIEHLVQQFSLEKPDPDSPAEI
jgi:hypothetical protein